VLAGYAQWFSNVTLLLVFACLVLGMWKLGKVMACETSKKSRILLSFLEKPDDADFARHFKNYFNKRSFGFHTSIYYVYQYDDERFYRNFRKRHYSAPRLLPAVLLGLAIGIMAAFGYVALYSLLEHGHADVSLMHRVLNAAPALVVALLPLLFIPVWKETRRRLRLVDEMDRRFRRMHPELAK
jgi:hypothetical protein